MENLIIHFIEVISRDLLYVFRLFNLLIQCLGETTSELLTNWPIPPGKQA